MYVESVEGECECECESGFRCPGRQLVAVAVDVRWWDAKTVDASALPICLSFWLLSL